jgi:raffinose/stachyose/melibiose transport system permease protein
MKIIQTFNQKMLFLLATILVLPFLPFFSIFRMIYKLFGKTIEFNNEKKRSYFMEVIVNHWISDTTSAQNNRAFVYFLFPTLSAFTLFVMVPFFHGMYLSMTNWTGLNTGREIFTGFDNYRTILSDYRFGYSLIRTGIYSALNILVINVVAFLLALLVTQNLKLKNIYRAGFFMPNLIGGLVLGYIWQFLFNRAIVQFGGIFSTSILNSGSTALFGLIIVVTWQYAGYGANAIQRLKTITLPLVAQAFTVAMFLTLVTSFKQFDTVMSLTQGGPATIMPQWIGNFYNLADMPVVQSTNLVAINIYQEAFSRYQMGVGQAKAIVFFAFLLVISLLQVYYNKRREIEL